MAKGAQEAEEEKKGGFFDALREDRYVLIVAVAVLIFVASASIALVSTTPEILAPVSAVYATVDGGAVLLSWDASSSGAVIGYDVYRSGQEGVLGSKLNPSPVTTTTYSDSAVPGTYYYTIRSVSNESDDGNRRQLEVVVAEVVPSDLAISINDGGRYATSQNVVLRLSAKDAAECRYKNDEDLDWGAWEGYKVEKFWTLSAGGDGERIVAYQCRNYGESGIALATVVLDRNAPVIAYVITPLEGAVQLNVVVKDAVSQEVQCTVLKDGEEEKTSIRLSSGVGTKVLGIPASAGEHTLGITCTDEAGNARTTPAQTVTVK